MRSQPFCSWSAVVCSTMCRVPVKRLQCQMCTMVFDVGDSLLAVLCLCAYVCAYVSVCVWLWCVCVYVYVCLCL